MKKIDDMFSRFETIHQRDRQTYGRTPDGSKDRTNTDITSRGKKYSKELVVLL